MGRNMYPAIPAASSHHPGAQSVIALDTVRATLRRIVNTHQAIDGPCDRYRPIIPQQGVAITGAAH